MKCFALNLFFSILFVSQGAALQFLSSGLASAESLRVAKARETPGRLYSFDRARAQEFEMFGNVLKCFEMFSIEFTSFHFFYLLL